jgi:hypothetical protein
MEWSDAKLRALDLLRKAYSDKIERVAEELRPRFELRELRGFTDADHVQKSADEHYVPPLWRLEKELSERLAGTEEDAFLVLACSESNVGDYESPVSEAGGRAGWDVLRVALRRGWYKPEPGEFPGATELLGDDARSRP